MAKTPGVTRGVGQELIFLDMKQASTQDLVAQILRDDVPPVTTPAATVLTWLKYNDFEAGSTPYMLGNLFNDYNIWWEAQPDSKYFPPITLTYFSQVLASKFQKGRKKTGICYYLRKATNVEKKANKNRPRKKINKKK
jgi:hypothetical protein